MIVSQVTSEEILTKSGKILIEVLSSNTITGAIVLTEVAYQDSTVVSYLGNITLVDET